MKSLIACVVSPILVAAMISPVAAQATKKQNRQTGRVAMQVFKLPASITLSADQQESLDALKKEYTPKLVELNKKSAGVMAPERRKTQKEATETAKAAGKKGKELREAGLAALNLTADERAQVEAIQKERAELQKEISGKIREILTEEQRAQLPKQNRKGRKNAK